MADETTEQAADKAIPADGAAKKQVMIFAVMVAMAVGIGVGGGMMTAKLVHGGSSPTAKESSASKPAPSSEEETLSVKLPAIIANLNEPKMQRYVHAVIILGVAKENHPHVNDLATKRKEEIKSWLVTYLSNLSMEEVRGANNLSRIRREILDLLNEQLFPNAKPQIARVLFEEFQVQ
ncbi:MAG: flagellar basal body-associated FliL family protein [Planctomycetota bacterium]|nr:flagellar basal body-associated FliL family protein [Planctomycetota bacterium]